MPGVTLKVGVDYWHGGLISPKVVEIARRITGRSIAEATKEPKIAAAIGPACGPIPASRSVSGRRNTERADTPGQPPPENGTVLLPSIHAHSRVEGLNSQRSLAQSCQSSAVPPK